MRRVIFSKNPIVVVGLVISLCCLFVIIISVAKLPVPDVPPLGGRGGETRNAHTRQDIGKFGEMMIAMLPEDLAFTIFMPSERAFKRELRMRPEASLVGERRNDTYAVVSRILAFCAIPRGILSSEIRSGEVVSYDSVSGFRLDLSRDDDDSDRMLVVNGVRAEAVDLTKGEIVVHIMDGVIMDAEFEQLVRTY